MSEPADFPDEATRPPAPVFEELTEAQRLPGRHLGMIHAQFREHMNLLSGLIVEAAKGELEPGEAAARADALPMVDNYRRFGNLCGQHCRIVEIHHSIEDEAIFPELAAAGEPMRRIVERLALEHRAIHAMLEALLAAIEKLNSAPSEASFAAARARYEALEAALGSHFGYEEEAIGDALGYYGIGV